MRERERHVRIPKKTAQPCIPLYIQSLEYVSDKFAEGVEMWFCWYFQMQNRSPFPSAGLPLFSSRIKMPALGTCCQKLAWRSISIPLCSERVFLPMGAFPCSFSPDSRGRKGPRELQTRGRGRESHLQIPGPSIPRKINMDVKLTLPI